MKTISVLLKILFTVTLLIFIFYKYFNLNEFILITKNASFNLLIYLLLLQLICRFILAFQMKLCFVPLTIQTSTYTIFKVHQISSLYSFILPGELASGGITWYLLSRDNGKRAQVASVMIYVKFLNLIFFVPFAILALIFEPRLIEYNVHIYTGIFSFFILFALLPFFWSKAGTWGEAISTRIFACIPFERFSKRLVDANTNLWYSIHMSRQMPLLYVLSTWFAAIFIIVSGLLSIYLAMQIVNINLPITVAAWIAAVLLIVQALSVTIGGMGLRELSLVYLLQKLYGIQPEASLLLSAVFLFVGLLFGGVLGGYFGVTLKKKKNR